jgi:uncharacterized protein (DUF433 family)
MRLGAIRGAYTADRAAALSGVPRSTIHYWARKDILVPSISASKVKLWSYTDLLGLRAISWLRHGKVGESGSYIPSSSMPRIREALAQLAELDLELFTEDERPRVHVDPAGRLYIVPDDTGPQNLAGMRPLQPARMFDIIAAFTTSTTRAPDLHRPRPTLRIVPGKLSGSPHIAHTRIETVVVASLADRFDSTQIERLYPKAPPLALRESIDLERQLDQNLRAAA